MTHFLNVLADAGAPSGGGGPFGGLGGMLPLILIFAIMYLLILRPQSKRQKELQKVLAELKKGDDVVTSGGLIGKITGMKDSELTLQLQEGVRVRVLRSAVTGLYTGAATATKSETKSEAKAS
ncbi:MAG TPA: preprotein translocase subunit YajC [Polyangia bacterium]